VIPQGEPTSKTRPWLIPAAIDVGYRMQHGHVDCMFERLQAGWLARRRPAPERETQRQHLPATWSCGPGPSFGLKLRSVAWSCLVQAQCAAQLGGKTKRGAVNAA
jgi:hypothetical protein